MHAPSRSLAAECLCTPRATLQEERRRLEAAGARVKWLGPSSCSAQCEDTDRVAAELSSGWAAGGEGRDDGGDMVTRVVLYVGEGGASVCHGKSSSTVEELGGARGAGEAKADVRAQEMCGAVEWLQKRYGDRFVVVNASSSPATAAGRNAELGEAAVVLVWEGGQGHDSAHSRTREGQREGEGGGEGGGEGWPRQHFSLTAVQRVLEVMAARGR